MTVNSHQVVELQARIEAGNKELAEFEAQQNQQTDESEQHKESVDVETTAATEEDVNKESVLIYKSKCEEQKSNQLYFQRAGVGVSLQSLVVRLSSQRISLKTLKTGRRSPRYGKEEKNSVFRIKGGTTIFVLFGSR